MNEAVSRTLRGLSKRVASFAPAVPMAAGVAMTIDDLADDVERHEARIEALEKVRRAAEKYRDSHTMAGANVEGEGIGEFTARILKERAALDEALAALASGPPNDGVCGACGCIIAGTHDCQRVD